jgi:UDP-N-acetylglucosamine--N-acetylmuramyl-(pentapeptide) pyrophosphoryl-undecaprenol N-acetylglucosamine transferase
MPTKYYSYPEASAREVGLPIDPNYKIYSEHEIRFLKEKLGFQADSQVVLVVGGSNGAKRLNQWCLEAFSVLLATHPKLNVLMVVGKGNLKQREIFSMDPVLKNRIKAIEFTSELYHLSAISDVIITRAGATTIAEFAAERKACILVPNPDLTGGHQLRNAAVYEDQGAALVIQEEDLKKSTDPLVEAVADLLNDTKQNKILGKKLNETLPLIDPSSALADILTSRGPRE